jgi:hypothetical protein
MPDEPAIPDPNDAPAPAGPPKLTLDRSPHPDTLITSPFNVGKESYKEIAQGFLVMMQSARSIENGVTAFEPLASPAVQKKMAEAQAAAQHIFKIAAELYKEIAQTAFNN